MLEKPAIQDEHILARLWHAYGVKAAKITFLPLGADSNTAVYRADAHDATAYFVKLRRGAFDQTSVELPKYLSDHGIGQIIAPLTTQTGRLSDHVNNFTLVLYPFVEGRNGYETAMSDDHWRSVGAALKRIHTMLVPAALLERIPQETYAPQAREQLSVFVSRLEDKFDDPTAQALAVFLQTQRTAVLYLIERASMLAQQLIAEPPALVVCHSDLHAGNMLINRDNTLYIVDWDNPIRAPKERDLMYVGGNQGFRGHTWQAEEALFYEAYGQAGINTYALAYYRYERIIQDLAIYCAELLLSNEGGADREQSLHYVKSNFAPGGTIEAAVRADSGRV